MCFVTGSTKDVTVRTSTPSLTVRLSNIHVSAVYQTVDYDFSHEINKNSETTLSIVPPGI